MKRAHTLLVVPLLLLAACASDDGAGGGSGAGGTRAAPATLASFPPDTQAFMEAALHQFSAGDPRWDATRREWLALGPRESEFLVQLVWGALLKGQSLNAPEIVERSRHELALIGEPSIALMTDVLTLGTIGTVVDPKTGAEGTMAVDDLQRREAAEVLSLVGAPAAPAVPAILGALDRAETKSGRRYALYALGNIGARGGDDVSRALVAHAADPDLALAVEAVRGMGNCRDAATQSSLLASLESEEPLLREKATESLVARGDPGVAPALRATAARAQSAGRLGDARRFERAAERLERKR